MPAKSRVLAALLATAALLLSACSGKNAVDQSGGSAFQFKSATQVGKLIPVADRKPAGDFSAMLLGGGTYSLASDKGKVTVVNYWASWCSPCRTEMPGFDGLYREVKGQNITFVGIDTKDGSPGAAQSFIQDNNISYPIVSDEPGKTALELGHIPSANLPFTVLVDKLQRIAAVYIQSVQPADLRPVLTELAAES